MPGPSVQPWGRLEVLGPGERFSLELLPADWVIEGASAGGERISVVEKQGVPALRMTSGEDGFVVVRRTRAMLLATPYLSWAWNMDPHRAAHHPVRMVVGFQGGNPDGASSGGRPFAWFGSALPPHDRGLAIAWSDSALGRGNLSRPGGDQEDRAARYTARGGRENTGAWWLETVDLSGLYAEAWPRDRLGGVRVVFIGVAAAATDTATATAGYFSGIVLSR